MYFNSLLSYGIEKFFKACYDSGVDGVIIPDLPCEESGEIAETAGKYNVEQITLMAPPSSEERIEKMAKTAKGFLYCVSSMGVTGVRREFDTDFETFFDKVNKYTNLPKCIGFGVSDADAVRALKNYCDGVIVGSAIVRFIGDESIPLDKRIKNVGNFTRELKAALT
jgi:tryptophan synthase alpha chain